MRTVGIPILCLFANGCAHVYAPRPVESNPAAAEYEARARAHIEKRARHEFESAFADFSEGMKTARKSC